MKPGLKAWFIVCSLTLAGCASTTVKPVESPNAQAAIEVAAAALAEAKSLNAVWVVWDSGMPATADAPDLGEILDVARKKQEAGDTAEAIRMAEKVTYFARMGVEQAKRSQAEGFPTFH